MSYIEIRNIFKIFGPDPDAALELAKAGSDKEEILAKTGNTVGLHDVSLSIEQGETFVVMGLSGSGKSTLIRHLNRLIDPTAGQVSFGGEDILSMDIPTLNAFRRKRLGMVFQRFGLLPHRNVMDNVAYGLEIQGTDRKTREAAASKWIDRVGLAGYEAKFPDQLSGGMQQRVGLARALATDPEVLLMDEAFSALDPLIRSDMQDELMKLQAELHKTIVFITHDLDEALKIGDRIAILKDGKLIQVGRPEEIVLNPADAYVQAFTRDVNRGKVLRARSIMEPVKPASGADGFSTAHVVRYDTRLEDILPVALGSDTAITVTGHDNHPIGTIGKKQILDALSVQRND
ncbi:MULTISPECIES: glycine betaine/L-proline ABC transporter ATP-binding protein [unclassified Thalassospira]|uniref:quaternary amine ABC transporter ATP-binding protein n=1 Tax=unclassified Thalassospira TaxID=2648997 RepID=UPI001B04F331|nr:glycine betaine/L-proline ABC transporter ATP-binding protein [Thalassospira sp.]MBO6771283.1 glycine betaine/L-proline ABC transporter ATP-binding protein [Thalassospira sp.]